MPQDFVNEALATTPENPLDFVEQALGGEPDDVSTAAQYSDTAQGTISLDNALGEQVVTQPTLPDDFGASLHAAPIVGSVGEAVVAAGQQGLTLRYTEGQWENIEAAAHASAQSLIGRSGGDARNVPDSLYQELVGAYRWIHTAAQAELADEEKDSVLQATGIQALDTAINRGIGRLNEIQASREGAGTFEQSFAEQEQHKIEQSLAKLQGWRSRLEAGDRPVLHATRRMLSHTLHHHDGEEGSDSLAVQQLSGIRGSLQDDIRRQDDDTRSAYDRGFDMFRTLGNVLNSEAVPDGGAQVVRLSAKSALQRVRAARFGISPDYVDNMGMDAPAYRLYSDVIQRVVAAASTPRQASGEATAAAHNEFRNAAGPAGVVEGALLAADTYKKQLAAFDPEQLPVELNRITRELFELGGEAAHALGVLMVGGTELTDRAFTALGRARKQFAQGSGIALQPWEQTPIDRENIRAGAESGRVDLGTAMRYAGVDDNAWSWGWAMTLENLSSGAERREQARLDDGDATLGIGKIVAERLQGLPESSLTPGLVRDVLRGVHHELVAENPVFQNIEATRKSYWAAASAAQRNGASMIEQVYKTAKAAIYSATVGDTAAIANYLATDPNAAVPLGALTLGANAAGAEVLGTVHDAVNKGFARMTRSIRTRLALKDAAAFDIEGLKALSEAARSGHFAGLSEVKKDAIADIAQKLADEGRQAARDVARLTTENHDQFWASRRRKIRDLDRVLRRAKIRPEDALDAMQTPHEIMFDLKNPARTQFLGDIIEGTLDKLHLRGHKLSPFAAKRNFSNVFRDLNKMLDAGEDLATIQDMPIPMVGTPEGYTRWAGRLRDRLQAPRVDWEKLSLSAEAGRWVAEAAPTVTALRDYNIMIQGRQEDLVDLARRRLAANEAMLRYFPVNEPGVAAELNRVLGRRQKVDIAAEEIRTRGWRESVKLSEHDALLDSLTFTDLRMWWETAQGPGAKHQLWVKMAGRSNDGVLDPPQAFFDQLREAEMIEEMALSGQLRGKTRKKALAFVRDYKKRLTRAVFDREVPDKYLVDASDDPVSFNPEWVRRVERQRADLEARIANEADDTIRADLQARLDAKPRIVEGRLPEQLKRAQELAQTIDATDFDAIFPKVAGWDFARPAEMAEYVRDLGIQMRGDLVSNLMRVQHFWEEYHALAPDLKRQFDDMLGEAARGNFKSWDDFFDKNPSLRANFNEGEPFARIGRAFENMESVRVDLLKSARDVGLIQEEAYQHFLRPYSPQLYAVDEFPKMVNQAARKRIERERKGVARFSFEEAPNDSDIWQIQRDPYKTKLLVQQNGSKWVERRFDTRRQAYRWLAERYGTQRKSLRSLRDMPGAEGKTGFGDRFVVLDPLGEAHMAELGLIGRGAALGARVVDLMRQVAVYRIHKTLDRPGFMMTERQWTLAQRSAAGQKITKGFVQVPTSKSTLFAPISGKYMHRSAAQIIQQALNMHQIADDMVRDFTEAAITDVQGWAKGGAKIAAWLNNSGGDIVRRLIGTNMIERGARTHHMNRITDAQVFARAAAGPGYLASPDGKWAQRASRQFLLGRKGGKGGILESFNANKSLAKGLDDLARTDRQLHEWTQDAVRAGMVGDSLLGTNPLTSDAYQAMTNAFFDEQPGTKLRADARKRTAAVKKKEARLAQIEPAIERLDKELRALPEGDAKVPNLNKQLARFYDEKFALEATLAQEVGPERLTHRARDAVKWFTGVKNKHGTFDQQRNFTSQLYQREGNIHRLGSYLYLRRRGHSHEFAVNRVRTFMQDYSNIRGWTRILRQIPVANPILSFPSELLRIQKNLVRAAPGFLLGWMSIVPALSMPALLSEGIDPMEYYMAQGRGNIVDAALWATSYMVVQNPNGGVSTVGTPQLSPMQMLRKPAGLAGRAVDRTEQEGGVTGVLGGAAARLVGQFTGNAATDAAFKLIAGEDAITHEKIRGGILGAAGEAFKDAARLFVPSTLPWFGTFGKTNMDNLRYPPRAGTGQRESAPERMIRSLTGIEFKGGLVDAVDREAGKPIATGTKILLDLMNITEFDGFPVPRILPEARGFSDDDIALWTFYANRKNAINPPSYGAGAFDDIEQKIAFAADMESHAERTGDTALAGWAKRARAAEVKELEARLDEHSQFAKLEGAPDAVFDREGRNLMKRLAKRNNFEDQFATSDLMHQTATLLSISALGLNDKLIENLTNSMIFQTKNSYDLTGWQDTAAIETAQALIEQHLQTMDTTMTGSRALQLLNSVLSIQYPQARVREIIKKYKDDATGAAYDAWRSAQEDADAE